MKKTIVLVVNMMLVLSILAFSGCGDGDGDSPNVDPVLAVTSASFTDGGVIAEQNCNDLNGHGTGQNLSPQLTWTDAPASTVTFVVIVDDATASNWSHWVLIDISPATTSLIEGYNNNVTDGTEGYVDGGVVGYEGPYPPIGSGTHTYNFTVYALDTTLGLLSSMASRTTVLTAMAGHILAEAKVTGTHDGH